MILPDEIIELILGYTSGSSIYSLVCKRWCKINRIRTYPDFAAMILQKAGTFYPIDNTSKFISGLTLMTNFASNDNRIFIGYNKPCIYELYCNERVFIQTISSFKGPRFKYSFSGGNVIFESIIL